MASATSEVGPAPTDAPNTQSARSAEFPKLCRPSAAELVAARKALKDMAVAKIIRSKATRMARATIACAIAFHAGEVFASDKAAKRAFGVKDNTNVHKLWVPRLRQLDEWRRGPPEIMLADGMDGDRLRYADENLRFRGALRAEHLQQRMSSTGFNPITGDPIQPVKVPEAPIFPGR